MYVASVLYLAQSPIVKYWKRLTDPTFRNLYHVNTFDVLMLIPYFLVLIVLAMYGLHRYWLVYTFFKHRDNVPGPPPKIGNWPKVTVQLHIFNERYVIERLVDAVSRFDYPRELLDVQILDDSTDETQQVARDCAERYHSLGLNISYHHRDNREGYKAGALAAGITSAHGQFVAIFDADFLPGPDFLRATIPYFQYPGVGMVQTRWTYVNRDYSLLTQVETILLDGHFVIEHGARSRSNNFFNFNGTAGVWRRTAIDDAGGWQHDTLTEDLDLSYRAQLRGWRFVFGADVTAPGEVPVEVNAFKSQQHRWPKGSVQTCRKLLPRILRSDLPLGVKAEAFFHLTANFNYPLMCILSMLMFPSMVIRYNMGWYEMLLIDVPLFFAATFSFCNFYMVCQREIHKDWRARVKYVPFLMSVGIGLSINNTRAVFEALFNKQTGFARTPKYRIEGDGDEWVGKKYRQSVAVQPLVELALGLYFTWTVFYALANQIYGTLPFLVLFQIGFLYTGLVSIVQQYAEDPVVLKTQVTSGK